MFAIGDVSWPGLSKLAEECGEVVAALSREEQDDGEVSGELADAVAACQFVVDHCGYDREAHAALAREIGESLKFVESPVTGTPRRVLLERRTLIRAGTVVQVVGKLMGTRGGDSHWDGGGSLKDRLFSAVTDLVAHAETLVAVREFPWPEYAQRVVLKRERFLSWHEGDATTGANYGRPLNEAERAEIEQRITALRHLFKIQHEVQARAAPLWEASKAASGMPALKDPASHPAEEVKAALLASEAAWQAWRDADSFEVNQPLRNRIHEEQRRLAQTLHDLSGEARSK